MSNWITSIEGTEAGHSAALGLALLAAFLHALFGAMQKGRYDPWIMRGAIDICYGALALPIALLLVPWPEPHLWPILGGAFVIHTAYKLLQAQAYSKGAYTVVYPVVRGTGPFFTVIGAWLIFSETFTFGQWGGIALLMAGIFGLTAYNLRHVTVARETLPAALGLAGIAGLFVALYTTYDAYGIRATANPFTFLAWFFVVDGIAMPVLAVLRYRNMTHKPALRPLMTKGFAGAILAFFSFGSIMLATRLDKVGEAAVLRETSTVFAALIGWLVLGEKVGPRRTALMALIAIGAVIVEFAG